MLDEGYYTGSISECVFAEGKSGNVEVVLKFDLGDNAIRTVYLYTTDAAWPYTREKLERLGWNGNTDTPEFSAGTNIELRCRHDEYQGKTTEKWDIAPGMKAAAPTDKRKRLEALWRAGGGKVAATAKPPANRPSPPQAATKPAAAPPEDDATSNEDGIAVIKTKQDAWDAWTAAETNPDVTRWKSTIAEVEKKSGKKSSNFTPAEWDHVAGAAVPF